MEPAGYKNRLPIVPATTDNLISPLSFKVEEIEERPSVAGSLTSLPSLQSQMLAHTVTKALAGHPIKISPEEFQSFATFWQKWLEQPVPHHWSREIEFLQSKALFGNKLESLFSNYQRLYSIYVSNKPNKISTQASQLRQQFAFELSTITFLFGLLCERDAGLQERPLIFEAIYGGDPGFTFGSSALAYKRHYQEHIHSHFLIFQRFVNFLHAFMEKEGAAELKNPFEAIEVKPHAYLAFIQESKGYIPVNYCSNSQAFEISNFIYGNSALVSEKQNHETKAFLVDHGRVVLESGFLLELMKVKGNILVSVKGFCGEDTHTPFVLTAYEQYAAIDAPDAKIQFLLSAIENEIPSFAQSHEVHDFYFIPLPRPGLEAKEFAYCFLQDMMIRSGITVRPEEQKQAAEWLKQIEQIEGKPAAEVMQELEKEIRSELRSKYEREVEEEQRQRSQQVIEGKTQGAGSNKTKKGKKCEKTPKKAPAAAELPKTVDERVEEAFRNIKVNGRIKFRKMMKMTQKVLKLHPHTFANALKNEKQQGSHHVLHMDQGTATIVQPHGRQDKTISPKSANRFLGAIIDQVKKALTS